MKLTKGYIWLRFAKNWWKPRLLSDSQGLTWIHLNQVERIDKGSRVVVENELEVFKKGKGIFTFFNRYLRRIDSVLDIESVTLK